MIRRTDYCQDGECILPYDHLGDCQHADAEQSASCGFCIAGDPVSFYHGTPVCNGCLDAYRESGRSPLDTLPAPPHPECQRLLVYVDDDGPITCSVSEFLDANETLDAAEIAAIRSGLKVVFGGGAQPIVRVFPQAVRS